MTTPEALARQNIDRQLIACGWVIQNRPDLNLQVSRGVAVREFKLDTGYADYLLFVDQRAVGVIEAKAEGTTLSAVAEQAADYTTGLPENIPHVTLPLPFMYESTGTETLFRDNRDPQPRSRRLFTFHRPETLAAWLAQPETLRTCLRFMPERYPLNTKNLWKAQIEAVSNLEQSFADDKQRSLIQMATGSGKTFTAVSFVYRLIKHAGAKRVLFLVDRNNLGRQAFKEFDQYITPDDGRKFTELYNVQHLQSNVLDDVSKVHITTIQRLFSMLSGEPEFDAANEETSLWEADTALKNQTEKLVSYNPRMPVEYYDFIITDECHRSIYNIWRQVLDYFDAFLIGLTATPSKQTFGFFNGNLVMEYPRQRAVADGVNVDGEVFRIRTKITESQTTIEKGWWVGMRDKQTRRQRWEMLEEDFSYDPEQLDRNVSTPDQIRTILTAYRDSLSELFPNRQEVPKTLIFAKDDAHAEEIVHITREVFGKGDDFCQKITYRTTGSAENLISSFRNAYYPRIAVTVDMIATGTDIKPLEALLFMRAVRSRVLFEQMLGRGTRVISETDFQAVTTTPNAHKTRFVIVDAVGVTEQELVDTGTVERKRSVPLKALLDAVAVGAVDDDVLSSLARRLSLLDRRMSPNQHQQVNDLLAVPGAPQTFTSLTELANALLDAQDRDAILTRAKQDTGVEQEADLTDEQVENARTALVRLATMPLAANPGLRTFLLEREMLIDVVSRDTLLEAGFNSDATERARRLIDSFQQFIHQNQDEIAALQILFSQPYARRRLDFDQLSDLANRLNQALHSTDPLYLTETLWEAYQKLERDRVRGVSQQRMLTDLVALVRHAVLNEDLVPYTQQVAERYRQWLDAQAAAGQVFSERQRGWLDEIAEHIGSNLSIRLDDLNDFQFRPRGGQLAAERLFGSQLPALLDELNTKLGV